MSQLKKKGIAKRSVEKVLGSKAVGRVPKGSWTVYIIASVVIAVILIIVGFFYYQEYVAPFQRTVITAGDASIRMDYFIKRARLAGSSEPMAMLSMLGEELLIKQGAPQYGIEVSPEEVTQELRRRAQGESETISDIEFNEWYRQQLNESKFLDSEYRDIVRTYLLAVRLHEYLAERVPTVAEQAHIQAIFLNTDEDAKEVRARWEAGEDFADLAREVSLDRESGEKGGDLGWFPRGVMDPTFDYLAFKLNPGEVSEPSAYYDRSNPSSPTLVFYYLFMVSEKADAREVSEEFLPVVRDKAFEDWLSAAREVYNIKWHGLKNGFDSVTDAWIKLQLAKETSTTGTSESAQ